MNKYKNLIFALSLIFIVNCGNSEEVPILDGSAKKFVESFLSTGFTNSNFPIKIIKIEKEVIVKEGEKTISINKSKVSLALATSASAELFNMVYSLLFILVKNTPSQII